MKKKHVFIACALPLLIWLAVPFIVKYPLWAFSKYIEQCDGTSSDACEKIVAMLGQSGDIFGMASSLFSGLALFAVAATLWADHLARRQSAKPLLICTVDKVKEMAFDEPNFSNPRSFRMRVSVDVKALNETALNIGLELKLQTKNLNMPFDKQFVQIPLSAGESSTHELFERLRVDDISKFINAIESGELVKLIITASCDSMENLSWVTTVSYKIEIQPEQMKLVKAMGQDNGSHTDWPINEAVRIKWSVVPNSWNHASNG